MMTPPLERILSGQSELCVTTQTFFVRDKYTRGPDGKWDCRELVENVSESCANEIIRHPCVVLLYEGGLKHYGTRRFARAP